MDYLPPLILMADRPDYEEPKVTTSFSLTEIARDKLQEYTDFYKLKSRSEFLERLSRGKLKGALLLNEMDCQVLSECVEFYIKTFKNLLRAEEAKPEPNEEFILYQSIKIAHLRLIHYRLKGDGENVQVDSLNKAYGYLTSKKELRKIEEENEFDIFGDPIKKKGKSKDKADE